MSTAHLLADLAAELRAELEHAVFGVVDLVDVDALAAPGFRAALAGLPNELLAFANGLGTASFVLVGAVDPRLAGWLEIEAPDATVRVLRSVESPAMALGHRWDTDYTDVATVDRKRETWLDICSRHARLADLSHDPMRVEVPAMPTTARKLELRGARR